MLENKDGSSFADFDDDLDPETTGKKKKRRKRKNKNKNQNKDKNDKSDDANEVLGPKLINFDRVGDEHNVINLQYTPLDPLILSGKGEEVPRPTIQLMSDEDFARYFDEFQQRMNDQPQPHQPQPAQPPKKK